MMSELATYKDDYDVVVVEFADCLDGVTVNSLNEILGLLGDSTKVVFVNSWDKSNPTATSISDSAFRSVYIRNDNVKLVDWTSKSQVVDGMVNADGSVTASGSEAYAALVAEAM